MASRRKGRIAAFQALYALECGAQQEDLEFDWAYSEGEETPEWVVFARLLFEGAVSSRESIDSMIEAHLDHWNICRLRKVDLAILRMSVYALMFQTGIPAKVTIDEAIHIAKEYGTEESYRFINGVLDAVYHKIQLKAEETPLQ
ncbi:transcription antitermination factor NusB [Spirochaeta dissipatitropha]